MNDKLSGDYLDYRIWSNLYLPTTLSLTKIDWGGWVVAW